MSFELLIDSKFSIAETPIWDERIQKLYLETAAYCYTQADFEKNPGAGGLFSMANDISGRADHFCRW